jgi:hypothetical protein
MGLLVQPRLNQGACALRTGMIFALTNIGHLACNAVSHDLTVS